MGRNFEENIAESVAAIHAAQANPEMLKQATKGQGFLQEISGNMAFEGASQPNYEAKSLVALAGATPTIAKGTNSVLGENAISQAQSDAAVATVANAADAAITKRSEQVYEAFFQNPPSPNPQDPMITTRAEDEHYKNLRDQAGELGQLSAKLETAKNAAKEVDVSWNAGTSQAPQQTSGSDLGCMAPAASQNSAPTTSEPCAAR